MDSSSKSGAQRTEAAVTPTQPCKATRRVWMTLAALMALVLLAPTILSMGALRSYVEGQLSERLRGDATVEDVSFGWLTGLEVQGLRVENPPVHFYRYLYDLVGAPWNWISRRKLKDEELAAIINDPNVYFYVLYVDGAPGGMAEIDARKQDIHELKFFGLAPDFTGCGLGRFFPTNVLDLAWAHGPKTLRLETCTLDHPAALPLYQKFGFSVIARRTGIVEKLKRENLSEPG